MKNAQKNRNQTQNKNKMAKWKRFSEKKKLIMMRDVVGISIL